jgi:hypothetical protein
MVTLSGPEVRDILANVGPGLDPGVRLRLESGITGAPPGAIPTRKSGVAITIRDPADVEPPAKFPPGTPELDIADIRASLTQGGTGRAVLGPKERAKGFTQEDIDNINAAADAALEAQNRLRANYVPIVGEKNASNLNAAFAEPDLPATPQAPKVVPGEKNQWGDQCARLDAAGEPVYACRNGHGYIFNRTVPGCPQCFMNGAAGSYSSADDPYAIDGEETF